MARSKHQGGRLRSRGKKALALTMTQEKEARRTMPAVDDAFLEDVKITAKDDR